MEVADSLLHFASELSKSLIREVWRLSGQVLNGASSLLLHKLHPDVRGRYYTESKERWAQRPLSARNPLSTSSDSFSTLLQEEEEPERKDQDGASENEDGGTIPSSLAKRFASSSDLVISQDKITTGLFEDLFLSLQLFVDRIFEDALKKLVHSVVGACKYFSLTLFARAVRDFFVVVMQAFRKFWARETTIPPPIVERVRFAGYAHESHEVTTDDGYILLLDRIPRPSADRVVLLQHGLADSAAAFLSSGTIGSVGFALSDEGWDVFCGNFRGTGAKKHRDPKKQKSPSYWDFSVNEHAFQDLRAFVSFIYNKKREENVENPQLVLVSHSMGAAVSIMYLLYCRFTNRPHHLSKMILLSPAGFHLNMPTWFRFMSRFVHPALRFLRGPLHPPLLAKQLHFLAVKVLQDAKGSPAFLDLVAFLTTVVLGGDFQGSPFKTLDMYQYQNSSPSIKVIRHGLQMVLRNRFEAYDYGKRRNLAEYGSAAPYNFGESYQMIDIPVYFLGGGRDTLIPIHNIRRHYESLFSSNKKLAHLIEFDTLGHLDFTLSANETVLEAIKTALATTTQCQ
mmetsp:Transcript_39983/g.64862  ORF Transcript_39983/g.64862 Transcript_39983/m.64862 type:complete len:567 (+) Transcript_39983:53-1753(+)